MMFFQMTFLQGGNQNCGQWLQGLAMSMKQKKMCVGIAAIQERQSDSNETKIILGIRPCLHTELGHRLHFNYEHLRPTKLSDPAVGFEVELLPCPPKQTEDDDDIADLLSDVELSRRKYEEDLF